MEEHLKQIRDYVDAQLARGAELKDIKRTLLNAGWGLGPVEEVLSQVSPKPIKPARPQIPGQKRSKLATLLVVMPLLGVVVGGWLFISRDTVEELTQVFIDRDSGFSFRYPESWVFDDLSSGTPGSFHWLLDGPKNEEITEELAAKYDIDENAPEEEQISQQAKASSDPLMADIILFDITLRGSPSFAVEEDLQEWRIEAERATNQPGVDVSAYQEIQIGDLPAYSYVREIDLGDDFGVSKTFNYVTILPDYRLEISVFPHDTNYLETAQRIVESISFDN